MKSNDSYLGRGDLRPGDITQGFLAGPPEENAETLHHAFASAAAQPELVIPVLDGLFGRAADLLVKGSFVWFTRLVDVTEEAAAGANFTTESSVDIVRAAAYQIGALSRLMRWVRAATEAADLAATLGNPRREMMLIVLADRPYRWADLREAMSAALDKKINPNTLVTDLRQLENLGFIRQLPIRRGVYMLTALGYKVARHLRKHSTSAVDAGTEKFDDTDASGTLSYADTWGGVSFPPVPSISDAVSV